MSIRSSASMKKAVLKEFLFIGEDIEGRLSSSYIPVLLVFEGFRIEVITDYVHLQNGKCCFFDQTYRKAMAGLTCSCL